MKFFNINYNKEQVSFVEALKKGLGNKQGLFFPCYMPKLQDKDILQLLNLNFVDCSSKILSYFIKDISIDDLTKIIKKCFNFLVPLVLLDNNLACLELYHGPTLAFKDFGARFMAQILQFFYSKDKITILIATSGDTGAAVAHAFYNIPNIEVIILYPKNRIVFLQEQLFCTLGKNITTIAIEGNFDDCQNLVKQAFNDIVLKQELKLNSANSINISRLLAQICYYFEAYKQIPKKYKYKKVIISVPSGNFGNLTAGLMAKTMGLPINYFIAATNANNTIVNYLNNGHWNPKKTITTLSNAMDVSCPNNWPRIMEIFHQNNWDLSMLKSISINDVDTTNAIIYLYQKYKYISEPHTAVSFNALKHHTYNKEIFNIFLGTAHPAKFQKYILKILKQNILLPQILSNCVNKKNKSYILSKNFNTFKKFLQQKYISIN
ncbi:threonine synthase [Enterobacteriaceae endosymbiont of Neohaemonia nigricornis]|uniref:threonine synthase n=1 Tax=Enterobacteriaceae endosymbiont of Neohaemonia nigricornis TaxID=2675792 RepID=UPI001448D949|nr:threonine synthase [Enterobacteriaceae endosymbiont of Neohaemonia nigricornis]QJC30555.1 threonine synthase [Enterobacteriaceae endosymbiont of Neohaemonia nigricornis]